MTSSALQATGSGLARIVSRLVTGLLTSAASGGVCAEHAFYAIKLRAP